MVEATGFWPRARQAATGGGEAAVARLATLEGLLSPPPAAPGWVARALGAIAAHAPFLCRHLGRDPEALAWAVAPDAWAGGRPRAAMADHLATWLTADPDEAAWMAAVRSFRNREMVRLTARDLLGEATLEESAGELSRLAEVVLEAAVAFVRTTLGRRFGALGGAGAGGGFTVVALGKLGAAELNYSSDIDLLYLYGGEGETTGGDAGSISNHEWAVRAAKLLTQIVGHDTADGRLFRVDLRLRPDGNGGPLAFTPEGCGRYYEAVGQAWERMALLRARPVAGDPAVGDAFRAEVEPFIYHRTIDPDLVESVREVKRKITAQLAVRRQRGFHVKLGTGGIREVEFFCQTLQVLHAGRDPRLRERNTFVLLDRLWEAGLIDADLHASQRADYQLLRRVEHRLQMEEDRQTHLLPPEGEARGRVACSLGFVDLTAFDATLAELRDRVHLLFQSLFAREESEEARSRRERIARELAARLLFVDPATAQTVLAHWPVEELAAPTPTAIADGFALLFALSEQEPVVAHLVELGLGRYQFRLAATDATGLVALSTGALAGFGLDIQDGTLFTLPRDRYWGREQGPWALQYLTVTPVDGARLDAGRRAAVAARAVGWATRWVAGERGAVRGEVSGHWVAALRSHLGGGAPPLSALELEIDNRTDPDCSVVYLWGADAPGFLHAFALGLAMRGVRVRDLKVRTDGQRVVDRFYLTDRSGRKIITEAARHEIEVLAVLIHGFAYSLARAADPALALAQFDTLLDRLAGEGSLAELRALEAEPLLAALATILGSGVHLFEDFLRVAPRHLLPVVAAVAGGGTPPPLPPAATGSLAERRAALIAWRDAELFRLDCDHLLHAQGGGGPRSAPAPEPTPRRGAVRAQPPLVAAAAQAGAEPAGVRVDRPTPVASARPFGHFGETLTHLADQVVSAAWALALEEVGLAEACGGPGGGGAPGAGVTPPATGEEATSSGGGEGAAPGVGAGDWAIFALGKLGGRELGYASDLELLFVYAADPATGAGQAAAAQYQRAVRSLLRSLPARRAGIFEIDLRLRPHGDDGPLATSVAAFTRYYRPGGGAAPFERQALIRLRPIVGDPALIAEVLEARDRFTYGPEPFDLAASAELRRRQIATFVPAGATHLKYGRGGLVEVEYAVQYRQIALGHRHRSVRTPNLVEAIQALVCLGDLDAAEGARLEAAYILLRQVIDAVRLERGNARDLLLPSPATPAFDCLAHRLGREPFELAAAVTETLAWVAARYARAVGEAAEGGG